MAGDTRFDYANQKWKDQPIICIFCLHNGQYPDIWKYEMVHRMFLIAPLARKKNLFSLFITMFRVI